MKRDGIYDSYEAHTMQNSDGHLHRDHDIEIRCDHVSFSYGKNEILHDISFTISRGVTGLLGVNGAGKTTLLSILATLAKPTRGTVLIGGSDIGERKGQEQARLVSGFLPQRCEVMNASTLRDNVAYAAWAHGVDIDDVDTRVESVLRAVDLWDKAAVKAKTLSGGQRQRLGIACALAHDPSILLLDEPTVGIDPLQRSDLRDLIKELGKTRTIILSTHLVDDVARIADNILMLAQGSLVYSGRTEDLPELASIGAGNISSLDTADAIEQAFKRLAR